MNKIKSTLFLASILAITATATFAQDGGQIPIVGKPIPVPTPSAVIILDPPKQEDERPSEFSKYLWALMNIIKQVNL